MPFQTHFFRHEKGSNFGIGAAVDGGNFNVGKQHNAKYEVNFKQGKDDVEKYDLDAHCRKQVSKLGT